MPSLPEFELDIATFLARIERHATIEAPLQGRAFWLLTSRRPPVRVAPLAFGGYKDRVTVRTMLRILRLLGIDPSEF